MDGLYLMETPIKMGWFGGKPLIFGNTCIEFDFQDPTLHPFGTLASMHAVRGTKWEVPPLNGLVEDMVDEYWNVQHTIMDYQWYITNRAISENTRSLMFFEVRDFLEELKFMRQSPPLITIPVLKPSSNDFVFKTEPRSMPRIEVLLAKVEVHCLLRQWHWDWSGRALA